jgi:uncharacterized protein (TIGR02996 family)
MSDEDALLRAIHANPDDDTPRLVYADWLDEHGQPERAEFIRVQVQIAVSNNEPEGAYQRQSELRAAHEKTWTAELGPFDRKKIDVEFTRGFPGHLSVSNGAPGDFEIICRLPLLHRLTIENCIIDSVTVQNIAKLRHLESLYISGTQFNQTWLSLLEPLPCWTVVRINDCGGDYGLAWGEFQERRIGKVTSLPPKQRRDAAVRFLRGFDYRDGLRHGGIRLDHAVIYACLQQENVTDVELSLLGHLTDLEVVLIHQAEVTAAGLQHLSNLPNLRSIELGQVHVNSITPLTRCRTLERLQIQPEIGVGHEFRIDDNGTEGLERLTSLRELTIREGIYHGIGDETVRRLASLRQLESLEIPICTLKSEDCFAALSYLTKLETLILYGPVSDHALQFFTSLKALRTLVLRGDCEVTKVGARTLAEQLPAATIILNDFVVVRAPRKSMLFRRCEVGGFASALLPTSWDEYPGDSLRYDKHNSLSVIEEGFATYSGHCQEGHIRLHVRDGDAPSVLETETHRSSNSTPHVLKRNVVKLAGKDTASCIFRIDSFQYLVCAVAVGGRCAVLNCEARSARFEEFRQLFLYVARSLRVGPAALEHVGEEVTVAVSRL